MFLIWNANQIEEMQLGINNVLLTCARDVAPAANAVPSCAKRLIGQNRTGYVCLVQWTALWLSTENAFDEKMKNSG